MTSLWLMLMINAESVCYRVITESLLSPLIPSNHLFLPLSNQSIDYLDEGPGCNQARTDFPKEKHGKNKHLMVPEKAGLDMIYTIEDVPPWYLCILLGLQVNLGLD